MTEESELNVLISNIVDQKRYSHCRLCLKNIENDNYARFEDDIAYSNSEEFLTLSTVLIKIFGEEIIDDIPGIDAVCADCVDEASKYLTFMNKCEQATQKLHRVLDSVNTTLNVDIDTSSSNHVLYIVCSENNSQLILVQKDSKEKPVINIECAVCKEKFTSIDELIEHNVLMHQMYTCKICEHTSTVEEEIAEHETSQALLKCSKCPTVRCTEDSLKEHEDNAHKLYVCKECGKSYKGLQRLLSHEKQHKNSKSICPKCGKVYVTKDFFNKHVNLCFKGAVEPHPMRSRIEKTYFCHECGKGYSTPGGLRVHNRFNHGNAKPHVCDQCGKKFTAPSYLKAHLITHSGKKDFGCSICDGKFVTKEALLYHTRRHTGEKPYSCNLCDEKFVNSSSRADHIKHKHIGPTLACELCSRKFVTKNFLRIHMKKHHDPSNKLYIGRNTIPPDMPGEQNMRIKI